MNVMYAPDLTACLYLPLYVCRVSAGFPSPAEDYIEDHLDLNKYLVQNPSATFYVKVKGDSMKGAGIFDGDLVMIDRSLKAKENDIVMCWLDGEFTLKRVRFEKDCLYLIPENDQYKPIRVQEGNQVVVWGVATNVIHKLK